MNPHADTAMYLSRNPSAAKILEALQRAERLGYLKATSDALALLPPKEEVSMLLQRQAQ